jgi:hypothetical protein
LCGVAGNERESSLLFGYERSHIVREVDEEQAFSIGSFAAFRSLKPTQDRLQARTHPATYNVLAS